MSRGAQGTLTRQNCYVIEQTSPSALAPVACVTAALHLYSLAQSAQMGDPRGDRRANSIPAIVTLPEVGDAAWPCGNCGHANLDHDYDGGSCTVTSDDPGVEWAECPCPTLTPAG